MATSLDESIIKDYEVDGRTPQYTLATDEFSVNSHADCSIHSFELHASKTYNYEPYIEHNDLGY